MEEWNDIKGTNGKIQISSISNLEWISNKDNAHHAINNGLWGNVFEASIRSNMNRRKAIIATRISDGEKIEFESISDAERTIGSRHVTDVLKGKRNKASGYTFEYKGGD